MFDPSKHQLYYNTNTSSYSTVYIPISGLTDFSISSSNSFSDLFFLGGNTVPNTFNSQSNIEINLSYDLVQQNDLMKFTGIDSYTNFRIYNGCRYFGVDNLFLNRYSINMTVGELPKVNASFLSYGACILESQTVTTTQNQFVFDIPSLKSFKISGNQASIFSGCADIYSFQYSLSMNRTPYYDFNALTPNCVVLNLPIVIDASINSKLYEGKTLNSDIFFNIKNMSMIAYCNLLDFCIINCGLYLNSYFPITCGKIVNSEMKFSNSNTLELKRDIRGYYGL